MTTAATTDEHRNPYPEPGQMWRDPDERATHQEFTVLAVVNASGTKVVADPPEAVTRSVRKAQGRKGVNATGYAVVRRGGRHLQIRVDRLMADYEYMGRAR